jgi:hypothetical protein
MREWAVGCVTKASHSMRVHAESIALKSAGISLVTSIHRALLKDDSYP